MFAFLVIAAAVTAVVSGVKSKKVKPEPSSYI